MKPSRRASGPLALALPPGRRGDAPLRLLCLGAHSDDIEIGCGATILSLSAQRPISVDWIVFSGGGTSREAEAQKGAGRFLRRAAARRVEVHGFRDGFFPAAFTAIKESFEALATRVEPDVIFTHYRDDRHQDHRVVSDLTWNTFRRHLVLEYEVPKYDGDLGRPNAYFGVARAVCRAKIRHLMETFGTQRARRWFTPDTFEGLLRLRGIESGAAEGYAEAFHARKVLLGP